MEKTDETPKEEQLKHPLCSADCDKPCCCGTKKVADTEIDVEVDPPYKNTKKAGCCPCAGEKWSCKPRSKSAQKCAHCCKKFLAFLFSQIGLCSLVVAYSILGGFIFMELEAPHEKQQKLSISSKRHAYVRELWVWTKRLNILHEKNWTLHANDIFLQFQQDIHKATKNYGWDGSDGEVEMQWTFAGSLLYAVTVITTIGYGHIAPKTPDGRLVTMLYAIVGIPLTLLCLANLGQLFGNCFRFLYKHLCRGLEWLCCPPTQQKKARKKKKSLVERSESQKKSDKTIEVEKSTNQNEISLVEVKLLIDKGPPKQKDTRTRVPIFVSLLVITLYIFGGAILFSVWEEDWDYLVGAYFCFITLSTIGFGDFVPGASTDGWSNQEKLIICTFYLVFGLSMVAMCFNLMQEEVRAKFRWLGQKLGIIDTNKS